MLQRFIALPTRRLLLAIPSTEEKEKKERWVCIQKNGKCIILKHSMHIEEYTKRFSMPDKNLTDKIQSFAVIMMGTNPSLLQIAAE